MPIEPGHGRVSKLPFGGAPDADAENIPMEDNGRGAIPEDEPTVACGGNFTHPRFDPPGRMQTPEGTQENMELDIIREESERDMRALLAVFSRDDRAEAKETYGEMMSLMASMGRPGRQFRREATRRTRAIVS